MLQRCITSPAVRVLVPGLLLVPYLIFSVRRDEAKSPAGSGVMIACGKLLARFLLLCPGRYFVEPMVLSES
jgi:hypothetical protein